MEAKIDYEFTGDLFTDVFHKYERAVNNPLIRYVVLYGGADSGKSFAAFQHELLDIFDTDKKDDVMVLRKVSKANEQSTYKLLNRQIKMFGFKDFFKSKNSDGSREITCSLSERKFFFTGASDVENLKSIDGYSRIILEEANQFEFSDFLEINRRARGVDAVKIIFVLNPTDETHWINKQIVLGPYKDKTEVIKVTYKDNQFITPDRVEELERLRHVSEHDYNVYVLGNWGIIRATDPYCWGFDRLVNVGTPKQNKRQAIIAGLDFNVGNSCTITQIYERAEGKWTIRVLKEYHFAGGEGQDLESLCKQIALDWGESDIHFTGDASGNNGIATSQNSVGANVLALQYIKKHVAKYWKHDRVYFKKFNQNPRTALSGWVMSFLFRMLNVDFIIDESCSVLISDLMKAKKLVGGSLNKKDCNDNDYGHIMDTLRYVLHAFCFDIWKLLSKGIEIPKHLKIEDEP